jgi:hypothetical protein
MCCDNTVMIVGEDLASEDSAEDGAGDEDGDGDDDGGDDEDDGSIDILGEGDHDDDSYPDEDADDAAEVTSGFKYYEVPLHDVLVLSLGAAGPDVNSDQCS